MSRSTPARRLISRLPTSHRDLVEEQAQMLEGREALVQMLVETGGTEEKEGTAELETNPEMRTGKMNMARKANS